MVLTLRSLFVLLQAWTFFSKSLKPQSGDRIIATADNLAVARAALDTAVSLWPGSAIEFRQKARVIARSEAR
jgi:hypothetical protein